MMNLVNKNFSYIQRAQMDKTWAGVAKREVACRITTLGTALLLAAESIGRIALSTLASLAHALSMGFFDHAVHFSIEQGQKGKMGVLLTASCLRGVFSPTSLESLLIQGPLKDQIRENRMQVGEEKIQRKLAKELESAKNQSLQEADGEQFVYEPGDLGTHGSEKVGGLQVGYCHYIGLREEMEDEHLATAFNIRVKGVNYPVKLFGVFDGHCGGDASKFLKENLKDRIEKTLLEFNPDGFTDEGIWNALKLTFVRLNQEYKGGAGSTATVALILDGKLWTANVGDSRTILQNGDEIIQLSEDANPSDPKYKKGVENRGGTVFWYQGMRVNGEIAVARSFGDHFLNGAMSARPKITRVPIDKIQPGSHLILGCDGIYDVASTRQVGSIVRDHARLGPKVLAKNIVHSAFKAKSRDNLSTLVVALQ